MGRGRPAAAAAPGTNHVRVSDDYRNRLARRSLETRPEHYSWSFCWSVAGSFTGSCFDPATPAARLMRVAALLHRPVDSKTGTDVGPYTILVREGPRGNGAWTVLRRFRLRCGQCRGRPRLGSRSGNRGRSAEREDRLA